MTTGSQQASDGSVRLERAYNASPESVWNLWTTPAGIEEWWAPEGFVAEVRELNLREGGELVYTFTATAPEQVEFMKGAGMPLTTEARKIFSEIDPPKRLGYISLIDFVPGVEPYEHLTVVDLEPSGDGVKVIMTVEPLHDEVWTERIVAGRNNELDNLSAAIARRRPG
jgi:uncharacterized protein YndB with AHSA1/START domain